MVFAYMMTTFVITGFLLKQGHPLLPCFFQWIFGSPRSGDVWSIPYTLNKNGFLRSAETSAVSHDIGTHL